MAKFSVTMETKEPDTQVQSFTKELVTLLASKDDNFKAWLKDLVSEDDKQ